MQGAKTKKSTLEITRAHLLSFLGIGLIVAVVLLALFFPSKLAEYVNEGLELAVERVLPTAFPFMILSSLVEAYSRPALKGHLANFIGRLFGMPRSAAGALVIGNVSGFPIGAKLAVDLYREGVISKALSERLIAYSNTPSPAFIVGSVGVLMLGSGELGILLVVSVMLGNILSAQFFRAKEDKCREIDVISGQSFDFVECVKSAGTASVTLISFIVIFSVAAGFVKEYITLFPLREIIIIFLEVTSAASYIASSLNAYPLISVALLAFALGFGGLSVMAQTSAFTSDTDISILPYFKIKLTSGILSSLVSVILYLLFFKAIY